MAKIFRKSTREESIISRIESSQKQARTFAISRIRDCIEPLSNSIATKLIDENLVETTNKNRLEEEIYNCLDKLGRIDSFDIDYQITPYRNLVNQPNVVSLYLTSFVIEQLINVTDIVDIYGSDEDIYLNINGLVTKYLN